MRLQFGLLRKEPVFYMKCPSGQEKDVLLSKVLADVSRAFYLSMRVLPSAVRAPISVAYMLARAADTIADNPCVSPQHRLEDLKTWAGIVEGRQEPEKYEAFWLYLKKCAAADSSRRGITEGEARLFVLLPQVYRLYLELDEYALCQVSLVVKTLISGMVLDLEYFPGAFRSNADLEHYTYLVAGCVGEFWSHITAHYLGAISENELPDMLEWGIEFGQALQYVNILRDLPKDLQNGRAYIPCGGMDGFLPGGSSDAAGLASLKCELRPWIDKAVEHFEAALRYIQRLPKKEILLRLAVIWPAAIGIGTIVKMVSSPDWPVFDRRVKISRLSVYSIILWSLAAVWSNRLLGLCFSLAKSYINSSLDSFDSEAAPAVPALA